MAGINEMKFEESILSINLTLAIGYLKGRVKPFIVYSSIITTKFDSLDFFILKISEYPIEN